LPDVSDIEGSATGHARGKVTLPDRAHTPRWHVIRRLVIIVVIALATIAIVYAQRGSYLDNGEPAQKVGLLDSVYYVATTLTTVGHGDIVPSTDAARAVSTFVLMPARLLFIVLVIGTTLEIISYRRRDVFRIARWRKNMGHHVVIVGYGTKGRSAVETLVANGLDKEDIVVVDPSMVALQDAHADGLAVVTGDATRQEVLVRAGVDRAEQVIITTNRDDSNVLSTLTVRALNPDAYIVSAVREQENVPLVKQSGANAVITSSDAVGRLLGLSSLSPTLGTVMEDLLTQGEGLEVAERELLVNEVGKAPQTLPDQVLAVVRDEQVFRYYDPVVSQLSRGDRLIVVRPTRELPWAPRPGTHDEDFASEENA